jgi:hypothetical protein
MSKTMRRVLAAGFTVALSGALWAATPMSGAEKAAQAMLKMETMLNKAATQVETVIGSLNGLSWSTSSRSTPSRSRTWRRCRRP